MKKLAILLVILFLLSGCTKKSLVDSADVPFAQPEPEQNKPSPVLSPDPIPEISPTDEDVEKEFLNFEDMLPLAQVWEGYTPEKAAEDGCVIFNWYQIEANEEVWSEFELNASNGYGAVRVMNYFVDEERLQEIKPFDTLGEYTPVTYDIICENGTCTVNWYEDGVLHQYTRKKLTDEELETFSDEPVINKYGGDAELAKADGCVLTEPGYGDVLHGSDMLSKYLTATNRRAEPSELKIAIVKDGVVSLVKECVFDGEIYTVTSAATDDLGAVIIETKTYSHMLKDVCHYDDAYYYLLLRKEYESAEEVVWEPIISSATQPRIYFDQLGMTP